jgi:hypothetical protein
MGFRVEEAGCRFVFELVASAGHFSLPPKTMDAKAFE